MDPEVTITNRASEDHNNNTTNTGNNSCTTLKTKVGYVVIPYTKGLSESFKKLCGKYRIQTYFTGNTTIANTNETQGPRPQGQLKWINIQLQVSRHHLQGGVHRRDIKVPGERHKEHLKGPSPIHAHIQHTGHNAASDNFNIIGREDRDLARTIK